MGEAKRKAEQALAEKKAAFENNPDDFIHKSEVGIGVIKGVGPVIDMNLSMQQIVYFQYCMGKAIDEFGYALKMEEAQRKKSGIVVPKSGGNGFPRF